MKKTYINPTIFIVHVSPSTMIAESTPISDEEVEVGSGGLVKEDFSFRDRSNVWDDDWDD